MILKENINYSEFIGEVKKCKKDVYLYTDKGDVLDLKSALSGYVFSVLVSGTDFVQGIVKCEEREDEKRLERFLQAETEM